MNRSAALPVSRTHVLEPKSPLGRASAPSLPRFEAAFRAVEDVLVAQGIDRPHEMRSPRLVERALEGVSALEGTLVIVDPAELRAAELDLEETVADERGGGALFVSLPLLSELTARRLRFRELGSASAGFGFIDEDVHPVGFGRFQFSKKPQGLRRWRLLVADTPGFRVALVSRPRAAGGFIGLWTGNPDMVNEITGLLRASARAAGHVVPAPAPAVPPTLGLSGEAEIWRQAAVLRGQREVRENELREIARAAALRGVELRRQRALAAAASQKKAGAA
jgi:hypothetical protein